MVTKRKTVIFDSSVWISYLSPNDINYLSAIEIVRQYRHDECTILVPEIVFYEVVAVFTKKEQYDLSESFIGLDFDMITLNHKEFLNFIFKYKNNLEQKLKTP